MSEKIPLHLTISGEKSCSTNFQISSRFLHEYNSNVEFQNSIDSFLEEFNKKNYTSFSMESIAPLFFGGYSGEQTKMVKLLLKDFLESFSLELNYQDMSCVFKYNVLANLDDLEIRPTSHFHSIHLDLINSLHQVIKDFLQSVKDKINGIGEVQEVGTQKKNKNIEVGKVSKNYTVEVSNSEKMEVFFNQDDALIEDYIRNLDDSNILRFCKDFLRAYVEPVLDEYIKSGEISSNKRASLFFCENFFSKEDDFHRIKMAFSNMEWYSVSNCKERDLQIFLEHIDVLIEVARGRKLVPVHIEKKPHNIPENLELGVTLDIFKKNDEEIEEYFDKSPLEVHLELLRLVLESDEINSLYDASEKTGKSSIRSFLGKRLTDFHDLGPNVSYDYLYSLSNGSKSTFFLHNYRGLRELLGIEVLSNEEGCLENDSIDSGGKDKALVVIDEPLGSLNEGMMEPYEKIGEVETVLSGDEYGEYMNLNFLFLEDTKLAPELIKDFTAEEKQGLLELIYCTYIRKYSKVVLRENTEDIDNFFAKQIAEEGEGVENFVTEIQKIHNLENTNFFSENYKRIKKLIQKIEKEIAIEYSETDEKIAEKLEKRSLIKRKEVIAALFMRYNKLRINRGLNELQTESIEEQARIINQTISNELDDYLQDILAYIKQEEVISDKQMVRLAQGFKKIAYKKVNELYFPKK